MTEDRPRSLKSPEEIARRRALLSTPHAAPLAVFSNSLRVSGFGAVPDFDPLDGGIRAKALFLFEKPGPKAFASGFISRNNDDKTAENTFNFMVQARIPRDQTCVWNAIPGWNGTTKVTSFELEKGIESLRALFKLLPELRVVVFVGTKAERARHLLNESGLSLLKSFHPSPKNCALAREKWNSIPRDWSLVNQFLEKG